MSTKTVSILAAISGILGVLMLGLSFSLNGGPPSDATTSAQLINSDHQNFALILWGAWLQAIGSVFIVLFAFHIVSLAGATSRIVGWMTLFGASTLMTVSLVEIVFYISALYDTPPTMVLISYELIRSVQHLYFIVAAPAFFIPLGIVILGSDVLPWLLGYLALLLGAAFAIAGVVTLLSLEVPTVVQASASIQVLWWLAAAIALIVRAARASTSAVVKEQTA
jgi:hypothetical protein